MSVDEASCGRSGSQGGIRKRGEEFVRVPECVIKLQNAQPNPVILWIHPIEDVHMDIMEAHKTAKPGPGILIFNCITYGSTLCAGRLVVTMVCVCNGGHARRFLMWGVRSGEKGTQVNAKGVEREN